MEAQDNKCKSLHDNRGLLYRKTQGKIKIKEYSKKIRSFTNEDVNEERFLSLEDTDKLMNEIYMNEIYYKKLRWSKKKYDCTYKEVVDFIQSKVDKHPFYLLIDEGWRFCGAYKVINDISYKYNFDELASDTIRIIAYNLSFQIRVDYDEGEIECEYMIYE